MTSPYHFRINRSHIATVTAYLKDEVNGRKRYFKAKHIAKDIGLKTGQVAGVMRWMLVNPSEFKISKEGYSNETFSGTNYRDGAPMITIGVDNHSHSSWQKEKKRQYQQRPDVKEKARKYERKYRQRLLERGNK